jgi:hypothetical protein
MTSPILRTVAAALSAGALLLTAGCGGGSSDDTDAAGSPSAESSEEPSEEPSPEPSGEATSGSSSSGQKGDAKTGKGFVDPTTAAGNKWFPLKPGTRLLREGTTMIGKRKVPHKVVSTVTDVVREINGVKTVLVLDEASGADQVVEKSVDYFALDGAGNVWIMGGVTEAYENGKFVGIDEAWLNGEDGAKGGILVPADPEGLKEWDLPLPPEEDADSAKFDTVKDEVCVPFDCYDDVMVIQEGTEKAVESELKYYAADVGQIKNEPKKSPEEDFEELENVTELSGDGLKEASEEAIRIDEAAAEEEPEMFGDEKAERV